MTIWIRAAVPALALLLVPQPGSCVRAAEQDDLRAMVTRTVTPLMKQYGIPGLAVGVTVDGHDHVFTYGVASKATRSPVAASTLFEIGSITKTFTATLASYGQVTKKLSLNDQTSADVPSLRGSSFDRIRLVNLGTHTAGGLPLQFPDDVVTDQDAMRYYRQWKPAHAAGSYRLYSNPSIMLLGVATATRLGSAYDGLMKRLVFQPLGLRQTFLDVPKSAFARYAQGYADADVPKRMTSGPLSSEAYGIRTTAGDMLRFIDANMDLLPLNATLQNAIDQTHTGYYRLGKMTQDLIWEQNHSPVALAVLLQSNSDDVLFGENKVVPLNPPSAPRPDVIIDKTGSTNGFSAYVAFVPGVKVGVVLLANKSYPIDARVKTAYRILTHLKTVR